MHQLILGLIQYYLQVEESWGQGMCPGEPISPPILLVLSLTPGAWKALSRQTDRTPDNAYSRWDHRMYTSSLYPSRHPNLSFPYPQPWNDGMHLGGPNKA